MYYQENPLPNWGPGSKAKTFKTSASAASQPGKRKADEVDTTVKKVKVGGEVGNEEGSLKE